MEKVTSKVEKWFIPEAHNHGWMYAAFVTQTTKHSGGCILISKHGFEYQQEQRDGSFPTSASPVRRIGRSRPDNEVTDVDVVEEE
jgi:hypothetical protein